MNYYGPTDFTMPGVWSPLVLGWMGDFLGTKDVEAPVVARSSPITYVSKGDPPVLTFQGTLDPLVPVDQAKRLHEALKKAGVTEHLEIIEGSGHGFGGANNERTLKMTKQFLDQQLKGKPAPGEQPKAP